MKPAHPIPKPGGNPLRVVVFTAGRLSPAKRVFFERLAKDPLLDLGAIIVDEYRRPRTRAAASILKGVREDGWRWLVFKLISKMESTIGKIAVFLFELVHSRVGEEESYERLRERIGVPIHRVADIHSEASLNLIRALRPQLGVILGGRILQDSVITIPEYGTLNIHKRKVPDYRGGGPVGYWEILAGESAIGVTIHYAVSQVDAGSVLAEATIPIEECDTLESLRIKTDLLGARLYLDTIRSVATGAREGKPQDLSKGRTYWAPSPFKVWKLERQLKRKAARLMPSGRHADPWAARVRVLLQYAFILPLLVRARKRFRRQHKAPVCILFYHVVATRPVNHLCIRLEEFARQVDFLRTYYQVVSLEEAVGRLGSGRSDEVAVALTFDDGYRDNAWAIEYLRYFGIPAAFFVSIGHVRDGQPFEHDRSRGIHDAPPMSVEEVRRLAADGFVVGAHGIYHEDFGSLDPQTADQVLQVSRELNREVTGEAPAHFSFPKGQRGKNITEGSFALAQKHFRYVYSAYGGYNFPRPGRTHFLRIGNPWSVVELAMVTDGYCGFRECLTGNAWGIRTDALLPY